MAIINTSESYVLAQTAGNTYNGDSSDQTYSINPFLIGAGDTITIIDQGGNNSIELPAGLTITSSQVIADQTILTLSNGAVVDIRGADTFTFNVGQNQGSGDTTGEDLTFEQFAQDVLGVTVPAAGEPVAEGGSVTVNDDGTATPDGSDDGGAGGDDDLAAALETLLAAREAETAAEEALDEAQNADEDDDGTTDADEAEEAVVATASDVDDALEAIAGEDSSDDFDFNDGDFDDTGVSENVRDALIADGIAAAEDLIAAAEADVATEEEDLADGTAAELDDLAPALDALNVALDDAEAADTQVTAELGAFNAVNGDVAAVSGGFLSLTPNGGSTAINVAELDDGTWVEIPGADFSSLAAEGFDDLTNFDDLLAALQDRADADAAADAEETALREEILDVLQLENDNPALEDVDDVPNGAVDTSGAEATINLLAGGSGLNAPEADEVLDARNAVAAQQENLDDLNDAVADYEAAVAENDAIQANLDALEDAEQAAADAAQAALEAITDDVEDGGLGLNLREGTQNSTPQDDVHLVMADGTNGTINNFGDAGDDVIYFGMDFEALVMIPDGQDIGNNVGDANALEILWEQDGNDLVLYLEEETFGGNSSGTDDVTRITLAGVDADDVSFADGFLTIA
ncbi:hypothetical protein [Marivita sp. GX14005]|uniref:hypothetical protein n=1 Tax=Marivita sp. GX14005 TaxID=2942276 RepID=UPI002019171B|nr:hypothetical protein [Marivita sp. GX14005]MCL3883931.1 hypothetical protein [Marivita sp. GX14005]